MPCAACDISSNAIKTRKSFISEYISLWVCSGIHTAVWTANSKPLTFLQINNWIHRCRISLIMSEKNKLRVLVHFTIPRFIYNDDVPCTVRSRYNAIKFLQNPHYRQRGVFCEFTIWFLICCCYRIVVCNTVRCRRDAVHFPQNINERHPIALPSGRSMGCLLGVQLLIDIQPQFLQWYVQYHAVLDRGITALECIMIYCTVLWRHSTVYEATSIIALWMVHTTVGSCSINIAPQLFHTLRDLSSNDVFVITLNSRQILFFNLIRNLMWGSFISFGVIPLCIDFGIAK